MIERKSLLVSFQQGLGKTVLSIAAIERLIDEDEVAGGFIICATSLKRQWRDQIKTFTDGEANVIVVDGDKSKRRQQYMHYAHGEAEYLIMNIEQVVNDWLLVSKLPRDFIVADEVQFAKNFKPQRSKKLKLLKAAYRWGLTGQPIENRPEDLFSVMEWIDPEVLGNWKVFDLTFIKRDSYGRVRRVVNLPVLHNRINEAMVRKTWEDPDVKHQMPKVVSVKLPVDFDIESARLYRRIRADLLADLDEAGGSSFDPGSYYMGEDTSSAALRGKVMSKLLCMRMLCDHPELLRISAAKYRGEASRFHRAGLVGGSEYAAILKEEGLLDRLGKTPKMDSVVEWVSSVIADDEGSKVVIFSFFKDMLHLLADQKSFKILHPVMFTGDMKMNARAEALTTFRADPECRLFLSSDAGGVGVDIPFANYLLSYDLPWSFGAWQQRNARIIRISSLFSHVTTVATMITDSIETRQYASLTSKQEMGSAILDGRGWDDRGGLTVNIQSLRSFLQEMDI